MKAEVDLCPDVDERGLRRRLGIGTGKGRRENDKP